MAARALTAVPIWWPRRTDLRAMRYDEDPGLLAAWTDGRTGTDAAPYFRIFNPVAQGLRYDPDGDYVRRWVTECVTCPGRQPMNPDATLTGTPEAIRPEPSTTVTNAGMRSPGWNRHEGHVDDEAHDRYAVVGSPRRQQEDEAMIHNTVHEFRCQVPHPVDTVFDWHRRPGALGRLLPPWQPVEIGQQATSLRGGTTVLTFPAGRTWIAQHLPEDYIDGRRFVDRLDSHPFVVPIAWRHEHDFRIIGDGTELVDRVHTAVPARLVRPMFAYRHRQLADDLAAHALSAGSKRLVVAITGASGLVGGALTAFLSSGGHRVIRLVRRRPADADEVHWDPTAPDPGALGGVDAVVHLAGHSIAGRFTEEHKAQVRSSRIEPTRLLARAAAQAGVGAFVSASAIGIYGADRGDEVLTEDSAPGDGFLAGVVKDWERAAVEGSGDDLRVALVRTGIVQSPRGGALRLQRPLFAAGLGGPMGSGKQWVSWIGIDDLVDVYHRALIDDRVSGPVNAVAPDPVRQREYATTLGRVLHRPAILPTPSIGPRLLLGAEGEREVASASQRVTPSRLTGLDHTFRFDHLDPALRHLLGRAPSQLPRDQVGRA